MKLTIFGSTGSIGIQLVKQALEYGHTVTAFVRDPSKLEIKHNNLRVVQGDVLFAWGGPQRHCSVRGDKKYCPRNGEDRC